jgi:hypothetical protein
LSNNIFGCRNLKCLWLIGIHCLIHPFDIVHDREFLNQSLGGTNSLYIMVDTKVRDGIENPEILKAIEQHLWLQEPEMPVADRHSLPDSSF